MGEAAHALDRAAGLAFDGAGHAEQGGVAGGIGLGAGGFAVGFQLAGVAHGVAQDGEGRCGLAEFVAPGGAGDLGVDVAGGEAAHGIGERDDGAGDGAAHHPVGSQRDEQGEGEEAPGDGARGLVLADGVGFGGFHGAGGAGHQLIDGGAMRIVGGLGFGHGGGEAGGLGQGGQEAGLHHLEETAAGGDDGAIQRLAQVGAQLWLGRPVGFAFGEFAREAGEAVQQGGTGGGFGGSQLVQGEQALDDVEWRREDIGGEVGAAADLGIDGAVDLQLRQGAQEQEVAEGGDHGHDQHGDGGYAADGEGGQATACGGGRRGGGRRRHEACLGV